MKKLIYGPFLGQFDPLDHNFRDDHGWIWGMIMDRMTIHDNQRGGAQALTPGVLVFLGPKLDPNCRDLRLVKCIQPGVLPAVSYLLLGELPTFPFR